jgi:hypothetical protein
VWTGVHKRYGYKGGNLRSLCRWHSQHLDCVPFHTEVDDDLFVLLPFVSKSVQGWEGSRVCRSE